MKELKIGDIVFSESRYHGIKKRTIVRFTNTMAVLDDDTKLRLPFTNGITAVGTSGYGNAYYYRSCDERMAKYNRQENLSFISSFKFNQLTDERLTELVNELKPL